MYYELGKKEVLRKLGSKESGLSSEEAKSRLSKYGKNELERKHKISKLKIFFRQFFDPIVAILIAATIVAAYVGYTEFLAGKGSLIRNMLDSIVIVAILLLNALLGFIQEYRAEKSIELLQKLSVPKSKVYRNGKLVLVNSSDLVPGDVVFFEAGDKVTADCRIIDCRNLSIDESILTGESTPVSKQETPIGHKVGIADQKDMCFSGTTVVVGRGNGVVVGTGMSTEVGKIAKLVSEVGVSETPLQRRFKKLGKKLAIGAVAISVLIFVIGIMNQLGLLEMILTALSLAVAIVPEGLPTVVTISLAIGVRRMLRKNALIRKLKAVETLGSTSHICVPGETLVFANPSIVPIKEVEENQKVLGIDGEFHEVSKTFRRQYSGDLISIKPVGLPEIKITPNHPILVSKMIKTRPCIHNLWPIKRPRITKLSKPEWIPAGEVTKTHVVMVPRIKKEEDFFLEFESGKGRLRRKGKILFDSELAELFGWYLAEGCCSSSNNSYYIVFYLGKHEKKQVERLRYLIKKKLGLKSYLSENKTALRLSVINKDLVKFIEEEFGKGAINKKIPSFILNAKKEIVISFIRAYLKGDGTISSNILSLRFSTSSKILAYQLVLLLNKIGIKGKVYHNKHKPFSFIEGRKVKNNPSYTVIINGTQADIISPLHRELKKKKRNLDLFDENFTYYTIRKITKRNETLDVYNIETVSQSYCLPFVVHNCSDKTGTLTKNEMTVTKIYANHEIVNVSGRGYSLDGDFFVNKKRIDSERLHNLLLASASCNNSVLPNIGDPTELALLVLGKKAGMNKIEERTQEVPFDSVRKYMMTTHKVHHGEISFYKGAPEVILGFCDHIEINGKISRLSKKHILRIEKEHHKMTKDALRVLGIAYKKDGKTMFLGLTGMIDPPRREVKSAIRLAKTAGIETIMITGDHKNTAKAIAHEIGITGDVVEGKNITKKNISKLVKECGIFARVDPEHKVMILEALQKKDEVVAMTGDGINDAPALKRADVGVAMAVKGTDVARDASDMVLVDDNYSSIVSAVHEGRIIYDNIKKFVKYLLGANLVEVGVILFSLLLRLPLPLLPLHLLWVNLVTDGAPALALGVDPSEGNVMKRKPRMKNEAVLKGSYGFIAIAGVLGTLIILGLFAFNLYQGEEKARTVALTSLIVFELFLAFTVRSDKSVFKLKTNKYLWLAIFVSIVLHLIILYTPLSIAFRLVPLGIMEWFWIVLFSSLGFVFFEVKKAVWHS